MGIWERIKSLSRKPGVRTVRGRPGRRWVDNIKMGIIEDECGGVVGFD